MEKIAQFTDKILPSWESIYKIELIGEAKLLRHGKRKLSKIEARSRDNDEMSLREAFKLGSLRLGIEQSKKILKTNDGSAFIPVTDLYRLKIINWKTSNGGKKSG